MANPRVLSVGQCGADDYGMRTFLRTHVPGATVDASDSSEEALAALRSASYDIVLVNRIFDADGASGLALIRQMKAAHDLAAIPVMLISNHASAQRDAITAGALAGFGKAELDEEAAAKIERAITRGQG